LAVKTQDLLVIAFLSIRLPKANKTRGAAETRHWSGTNP